MGLNPINHYNPIIAPPSPTKILHPSLVEKLTFIIDFLYLRSLISMISDWVSFLAYPNLFGIKGFVVVDRKVPF
jgi:hypothetical protein